jgi:hypothetical protein
MIGKQQIAHIIFKPYNLVNRLIHRFLLRFDFDIVNIYTTLRLSPTVM